MSKSSNFKHASDHRATPSKKIVLHMHQIQQLEFARSVSEGFCKWLNDELGDETPCHSIQINVQNVEFWKNHLMSVLAALGELSKAAHNSIDHKEVDSQVLNQSQLELSDDEDCESTVLKYLGIEPATTTTSKKCTHIESHSSTDLPKLGSDSSEQHSCLMESPPLLEVPKELKTNDRCKSKLKLSSKTLNASTNRPQNMRKATQGRASTPHAPMFVPSFQFMHTIEPQYSQQGSQHLQVFPMIFQPPPLFKHVGAATGSQHVFQHVTFPAASVGVISTTSQGNQSQFVIVPVSPTSKSSFSYSTLSPSDSSVKFPDTASVDIEISHERNQLLQSSSSGTTNATTQRLSENA